MSSLVDLLKTNLMDVVIKTESEVDILNGINIMPIIPSRDAYSFALQLMDMIFCKDKLVSALLFKTKKSSKPGLDLKKNTLLC